MAEALPPAEGGASHSFGFVTPSSTVPIMSSHMPFKTQVVFSRAGLYMVPQNPFAQAIASPPIKCFENASMLKPLR